MSYDAKRALQCVREARGGATLRAADWDQIEMFLCELVSQGVHRTEDLPERLERRGRVTETDCVTGEGISFPPIGRRKVDAPLLGPGGCTCNICGPEGDHVACAACCPYREGIYNSPASTSEIYAGLRRMRNKS